MQKFVLYVVPCPVTEAQCEERQEICQDLILSADDDLTFLCDTWSPVMIHGVSHMIHKLCLCFKAPASPLKM